VEKAFGWSVEFVERRRKPAAWEVLKLWAEQWSKESVAVKRKGVLRPKGFQVLPKRWWKGPSPGSTRNQKDEQRL